MTAAPIPPAPILDQTLIVQFSKVTINGVEQRRAVYNGQFPGPTLRIPRGADGGQMRIKLVNQLNKAQVDGSLAGDKAILAKLKLDPGDCPPDGNHNQEHGLLTTNLHTHGLHVSPDRASTGEYADNIFVEVRPAAQLLPAGCNDGHAHGSGVPTHREEGTVQYVYDILPDHPAGTFWYHAHKHGSTAWQVEQGLFGALIVEEEDRDKVPAYIRQSKEHILFHYDTNQWISDRGQSLTDLLNQIGDGEVQRWRVINASAKSRCDLGRAITGAKKAGANFPDVTLFLIAFDGLMLDKRHPVIATKVAGASPEWAQLAMGNRADFLVARNAVLPDDNLPENTLVAGLKDPTKDPTPPVPVPVQCVDLTKSDPITSAPMLDGEEYDGQIKRRMLLGTIEEWTIRTRRFHPFHIHVNPFFVVKLGPDFLGPSDPRRRWQDTIAVNEEATALMQFADFTGPFVLHCHNLVHEETGMMQAVEVVDSTGSPLRKVCL